MWWLLVPLAIATTPLDPLLPRLSSNFSQVRWSWQCGMVAVADLGFDGCVWVCVLGWGKNVFFSLAGRVVLGSDGPLATSTQYE